MNMIERLAIALYEDYEGTNRYQLIGEDDETQRMYRSYARAAIKAMRKPTERMIAIGDNTPTGHSWGDGAEYAACEPLWEAMIDAALEEPADAQIS